MKLIANFTQRNLTHTNIINITENEINVIVKVKNLQTGGASSVITQPFHIVKISKRGKPIVFE